MSWYCSGGQNFFISHQVSELEAYKGTAKIAVPFVSSAFISNQSSAIQPLPNTLICQANGWVMEANRQLETWSAPSGILLKVAGGNDFYIRLDGQDILCLNQGNEHESLSEIDRQILLGPVLVLTLALRGTWCLHASAAICNGILMVFLGESGQGKSTLAASLATFDNPGWRLVADDILPVTIQKKEIVAWPRFPQLKLPLDAQPGPGLPEQLRISKVCILTNPDESEEPGWQLLPSREAVQAFLGHTAGTRLFPPELLAQHLDFCAQAATRVPVYRLNYPHRRDMLPRMKELLETIC
jgi:hypothetical protein